MEIKANQKKKNLQIPYLILSWQNKIVAPSTFVIASIINIESDNKSDQPTTTRLVYKLLKVRTMQQQPHSRLIKNLQP